MQLILLMIVVAFSLTMGCSSSNKAKQADHAKKHLAGTDEQIFIGDTIEKNYDPNVILKRAESFFDKEDYPEAVIEYTHFLELHRIHTLAPYAQFKLGESHLRMVKSVDRDPEPIAKALDTFERLLKEYPGSRYEAETKEKIFQCHDLMAQAYLVVGHFYYRRESYLAAAYRFESVLNKFPDMKASPEALYYLALSYKELGADDWAQENLTVLAERYPGNPFSGEGLKLLTKLNLKRPPDTMIALAPTEIDDSNGSNGVLVSNGTGNGTTHTLPQPALSDGQAAARPVSTPVALLTAPAGASLTSGVNMTSGAAPTPGASLVPQAILCRTGSWC